MASAALLWFAAPAGAIPLESWDDKIPNATQRFKVLSEFGGAAVLDRETGLVWEQNPLATLPDPIWVEACLRCMSRTSGGRKGWRLPSVHELASLLDPTQTNQALPTGHPFTNVRLANYWTATSIADSSDSVWVVNFSDGTVSNNLKANSSSSLPWCVRGGMNADRY